MTNEQPPEPTGEPPSTLITCIILFLFGNSFGVSIIKGFALTRQGKRRYSDAIIEKVDPRGKKYYWIGGGQLDFVAAEGTDFSAVHSGLISITPLHLDLTNYASLRALEHLKVQWP